MVKIISHEERLNSDQEKFSVLILESDIQTVASENGVYFTTRKTSVPCSFSAEIAKKMIGRELPGKIIRVPCESYEFSTVDGEVIMLNHTYEYSPNEHENMEEAIFSRDEELV